MAVIQDHLKQEGLRRAAFLVFGALALILVGVLSDLGESAEVLVGLGAFTFWVAGTVSWAQAKGWHWGWGLLGLSLIGVIVIALLPDRHSIETSQERPLSALSKPIRLPSIRLSRTSDALRRKIPLFALATMFAITLYPPWSYTFTQPGMAVVRKPGPRAFLFLPPSPERAWSERFGVVLDGSRLLVEFVAVAVGSGLIYVAVNRGSGPRRGA